VQAAFEIAEKNGDRLESAFSSAKYLSRSSRILSGRRDSCAVLAFKIQLFKLIVRESKKITQSVIIHESP